MAKFLSLFPSVAHCTPLHFPRQTPSISSSSSSSLLIKFGNPTRLPSLKHPICFSRVNVCASSEPEVEFHSNTEEDEGLCAERLLASNIPWTCTPEDIRSLFEKFGTVTNVELLMHKKTRNRGLAFVTMGSPEEAAAALKGLELWEFEGRTLKLNYAKPKKEKPSLSPTRIPGLTFNLFVSNLSFEARDSDLKQCFISEDTKPSSAEIIFHDSPRRSSGYGFVSFETKKQADKALKAFQGKLFMGRSLRVARSRHFARESKKESDVQPVGSELTDVIGNVN